MSIGLSFPIDNDKISVIGQEKTKKHEVCRKKKEVIVSGS